MNAATSVAANTEEARGAYSRRDFALKNCIALKEIREARLWLRIIQACELAPKPEFESLLVEAGELVGILTATVRTARQPRNSQP
jgi:four helix bundle protein